MLVSEIAERVKYDIGDQGNVYVKAEHIKTWVNEAIRDIFRKSSLGRYQAENFDLTVGQNSWTPTHELLDIHSLSNGKFSMEEIEYSDLIGTFSPDWFNTQGAPRYYWRGFENGKTVLKFAQTADTTYNMTISYSYTPDELDLADNTNTVLPEFYADDIVRFCSMRAHERNKDFRASEKAEQQYSVNLADRIEKSRRLSDSFDTITPDEYDYL